MGPVVAQGKVARNQRRSFQAVLERSRSIRHARNLALPIERISVLLTPMLDDYQHSQEIAGI